MSRVLAIGDIHTKTWIVEKVSKIIDSYDSVIFTGDYADDFNAKPQDTINTWNTLKDLQKWLMSLPVIVEIDSVSYSHAGIANEWSGGQDVSGLWNDTSPLWARPGNSMTYKNIPQVFGHTPTDTCRELKNGVWCIDTFSTMPAGSPIGDGSVLQVIDGKKFSKIYLKSLAG